METGVVKSRRGRKRKRNAKGVEKVDKKKKVVGGAGETSGKEAGQVLTALVGRYVRKEFPGFGFYLGKIVSYSEGFYKTDYEDGDSEDLESHEIYPILVKENGFTADLKKRKKKLDQLIAKNQEAEAEAEEAAQSEGSKGMKKRKGLAKGVDRDEVSADDTTKQSSDLDENPAVPTPNEAEAEAEALVVNGDHDSSSESSEIVKIQVDETPLPPPPLLPASSGNIGAPDESVSYLFSVYSFLRSYSIQLFICPFRFEDFVGSLNCLGTNTLLDGIHFSLLRALWRHLDMLSSDGSGLAAKCLRRLDWSLLDTLTWPLYLVEYFLAMGYAKGPDWKGFYTDVVAGEYDRLSVTRKLLVLQILCDDITESAELRAEVDMRASLEEGGDCNGASILADNRLRRVHPRYSKTAACKDVIEMTNARNSKAVHNSSEIGTDAADVDQDGNSDECRLCGMDGHLLCCDGCPSAYHPRCIGTHKLSLPDGLWFCPECTVNKAEPTLRIGSGLRGAELFGIDPYEHMFMGICNHLLVLSASTTATPSSRYYNQNDIPKILQVLGSSVQHKSFYSGICKGIQQCWNISEVTNFLLPERIEAGVNSADGKEDATVSVPCGNVSVKETTRPLDAVDGDNHTSNAAKTVVENGMLSGHENVLQEDRLKTTSLDTVNHPGLEMNVGVTVPTVSSYKNFKSGDQFGTESAISSGSVNHKTDDSDLTQQSLAKKSSGLDITGHAGGDKCSSGKDGADGLPLLTKNDMSSVRVNGKGDAKNDCLYMGASFKPSSYTNQYFLGDIAASAAANLFVIASEEKGVTEVHDSSKRRKIASANAALQVKAFSKASVRFFWPNLEKKLMEVPRERCGWCLSCKAPTTSRKGCLLNAAATNAIKASARIRADLRNTKNGEGSISSIVTYMLYMEESLRGLVVGPFLSESYRKQWRKQIEKASSFAELKFLLLKFEEHIRLVAFSGGWLQLVDDWSVECSSMQNGSCSVGPTPKRPGGRRNRKQATISEIPVDLCNSDAMNVSWWRGGKLSKLVFQRGMLPHSLLRKAARQGRCQKISGIHYGEGSEIPRRTRQFAWRTAVEVSQNAPQLALQVRNLDIHVRWSDLIKPEQYAHDKGPETEATAFRNAYICDKKVQENKIIYGLAFGNQKHLPSRVMKNTIKVEQGENTNAKYWFSEIHIPLFLIKEYEEKSEDALVPAKAFDDLSKLQRRQLRAPRRDIFSCLMNNGKNLDKCPCSCCQEDVLYGDAVKCNECEGYCHKDCTRLSTVDTKAELDVVTCNRCYNEVQGSQSLQQSQEHEMVAGSTQTPLNNGFYQSLESIWDIEPHSAKDLPFSDSNVAPKGKRKPAVSSCIIWKKKHGEDTGTNFRLNNILLGGSPNVDASTCPKCHLCNKPYDSGAMFICCEDCPNWYHADAFQLKESQIFDVVGFKCSKCRKKASPTCPYLDQDCQKTRVRASTSRQGRMVTESGSGTISKPPRERELTAPVSQTKMDEVIVQDDDPLLFSLERVELVPESSPEYLHEWNASGVSQGPQKLPVRRHAKYEKNSDAPSIPPHDESTPCEENMPPSMVEYGMPVDGPKDEVFDYDGVNYDGDFEPQTYFSYTELLAPDGTDTGEFDSSMDLSNIWDNSLDYGTNTSYDWPGQYQMDSQDLTANGASASGRQDDDVKVEPAINVGPCQACSQTDPAPDLCCGNCGIFMHTHCSEPTDQTFSGKWKCSFCREWR